MRFRRRKPTEDHGNGAIVKTAEHRCQPPGCYEWPAGEWYISKPKRYPEGTIWQCGECGEYWQASRYDPMRLLGGNGLWMNWWPIYGRQLDKALGRNTAQPEGGDAK